MNLRSADLHLFHEGQRFLKGAPQSCKLRYIDTVRKQSEGRDRVSGLLTDACTQ
jgi:hypothetical protein